MESAEHELMVYICPVCGYHGLSRDEQPVCKFCKNANTIIIPDKTYFEFQEKTKNLSPLEYRENLRLTQVDNYYLGIEDPSKQKITKNSAVRDELLNKEYVYNNPLFDKAKSDMREEWEYERAVEFEASCAESRKRQEEKSKPHCPKCGCTEFQMVPRKWSPLTGFLTNKTDRVCVKCKTRF